MLSTCTTPRVRRFQLPTLWGPFRTEFYQFIFVSPDIGRFPSGKAQAHGLFSGDQRERLAFASIIVREILGDNGSTCPRLLGSSEVGRHHSLGRLRSRELAKSLIKRHCYATHWASFKFVPVTCLPLSHKDVASDDGIVIKTELVLLNLTRNVHVSGKGIQY